MALKVLAPFLAGNANARKHFVREGRTAAAIQHEHVIAVHEVAESAGLPYLVLQYVEGASLQQCLNEGRRFSIAEIVRISREIAAGLAAAHAQGMIHRDIKPGNILIEKESERIKITDFGLARSVDDVGCTSPGTILGTPLYMAPEQANGDKVDARADLYSLGAVMYCLAAGNPPFQADTTLGVLKRTSEAMPVSLRSFVPISRPHWTRASCNCSRKNRARHASAAQLADCLAQCEMTAAEQGSRDEKAALVTAGSPAASHGSRPWPLARFIGTRTYFAGGIALALAGLLVLLETTGVTDIVDAVADVFRIRTPHGTLIVETTGSNVVTIEANPGVETAATPAPAREKPNAAIAVGSSEQPALFVGHTGVAVRVGVSGDGKLALSCGGLQGDKTIRLWDFATGKEIRQFHLHPEHPFVAPADYPSRHPGEEPEQWSTVAFSNDGTRAVTGNFGGLAVIWDVASGRELVRLLGQKAGCTHAVFSPDDKKVLSGTKDGMLHLWDAATGDKLKEWTGHTKKDAKQVRRVAFLPDGKRALSAGYDQTVKLWDLNTSTPEARNSPGEIRTFAGHHTWVQGLAVSRDGKWFLSGSDDIRLWEIETGQLVCAISRFPSCTASTVCPCPPISSPSPRAVTTAAFASGTSPRASKSGRSPTTSRAGPGTSPSLRAGTLCWPAAAGTTTPP